VFILMIFGIHCSSTSLVITPIPGPAPNLTDTIFWSDYYQSIFYADFWTVEKEPSIFRYDFISQKIYGAYIEGKSAIAYVIPVDQCGLIRDFNNDLYLSGAQHDNFLIKWNGKDPKATVVGTVFKIEPNITSSHVDLGVQTQAGKFIFGTTTDQYCLGPGNSSVYKFSKANGVELIDTGFLSTAGLAYYGNTIYHTDVCRQKIEKIEKDSSGNYVRSLVYSFVGSNPPIVPSGLEVDIYGNLYVVGYGTGTIWQINPTTLTANLIATLPSPFLTGVAFGGPKRDILFALASSILFNSTLDIVNYTATPPLYKITGLNTYGIRSKDFSC